jgi:hypothetical protein
MNIHESEEQRWNTALLIAIADLNNPNPETRQKAIAAGCYGEFMEVRQMLIVDAHRKFTYAE